jgi:hypothetical protein
MRFAVPIALSVFATVLAIVVTSLIARATIQHVPAIPTEEPS